MNQPAQIHVGHVEEYNRAPNITDNSWHYTCHLCGQRLRFPSGKELEFACNKCKQIYTVTRKGNVYSELQRSSLVAKSDIPISNAPSQSPPQERSGLLGKVASLITGTVDLAKDANAQANGRRLREGLLDSFNKLKMLDTDVSSSAVLLFRDKALRIQDQRRNWSVQGAIKVAREMQSRARSEFDFNQTESYALWLAGAWLESDYCKSEDAHFVRRTLDNLLNEISDH